MLRGARTRMARKPSALARELLKNFPKGRRRRGGRRKRARGGANAEGKAAGNAGNGAKAAASKPSEASAETG